jgi:hypothetical protein
MKKKKKKGQNEHKKRGKVYKKNYVKDNTNHIKR